MLADSDGLPDEDFAVALGHMQVCMFIVCVCVIHEKMAVFLIPILLIVFIFFNFFF